MELFIEDSMRIMVVICYDTNITGKLSSVLLKIATVGVAATARGKLFHVEEDLFATFYHHFPAAESGYPIWRSELEPIATIFLQYIHK